MRPKINVFIALLAVLALVALVAVGCGGTTTTTAGGATTTAAGATTTTAAAGGTTTTAAPGGADIPIGFLTSYTGELGAYGQPWYNAGKMAADDINAAGGVLGQKIVLYTEDDASAVEKGIQAARKLISVNKVIAIAGPISDVLVGIYPICKDNKVFVTSEAAGTTKLDTGYGEWFYPHGPVRLVRRPGGRQDPGRQRLQERGHALRERPEPAQHRRCPEDRVRGGRGQGAR